MPERRVALIIGAAAMLLFPAAGGAAADGVRQAAAQARAEIDRNESIGAESRLRKALAAGAPRRDVAAAMGAAMLAQGNLKAAREWLGPGQFASADAAYGFRNLAALERMEGNLPAAGRAFDRALALTPDDAGLWVEIGRLRYAGEQHLLAIEAADRAIALGPQNVRALEFKGQIVRDQYGLSAALPWFETALALAPRDVSVLGEYAATLGELGRASDMLRVTGQLLAIEPGNARALYLRAVMAARAGDDRMARLLLNKAGDRLQDVPGALLLDGVINLRTGNAVLAVRSLDRLAAMQPGNARARMLLAAALAASGDHAAVVARFAEPAGQGDAAPYLSALVGRAFEALGNRQAAAFYLDRAANPPAAPLSAVSQGSLTGGLIAQKRFAEAEARGEQSRQAAPGSAFTQAAAGDAQFALGRPLAALDRYRAASRVRMTAPLLARVYVASLAAGQQPAAAYGVAQYLAQNPSSRTAQRLAAGVAAGSGDWSRARGLLEHLHDPARDNDPRLLAELAMAQLHSGADGEALTTAARAYALQPAGAAASMAFAEALTAGGADAAAARALTIKARKLVGR